MIYYGEVDRPKMLSKMKQHKDRLMWNGLAWAILTIVSLVLFVMKVVPEPTGMFLIGMSYGNMCTFWMSWMFARLDFAKWEDERFID